MSEQVYTRYVLRVGAATVFTALLSSMMPFNAFAARPCIDLRSDLPLVQQTIAIEKSGREILISRATISFYQTTSKVGIRPEGTDQEELYTSVVIKLTPLPPNPAAQQLTPKAGQPDPVSLAVPLTQVRIARGVLEYPDCIVAPQGHQTTFDGELTFSHGRLRLDGSSTDYARPRPPSRTLVPEPRAKPGP